MRKMCSEIDCDFLAPASGSFCPMHLARRNRDSKSFGNVIEFKLTDGEIHLVRQWFDSVQDNNPAYLQIPDYVLAKKVYESVGWRVPDSVSANC